jgi:amino acid adenylation domain-containing protein
MTNRDHDNVDPERLHHSFVRQAQLTPLQDALVHAGRSRSYRELDQRSNQLAHLLRQRGDRAGLLVGLCLERSADLVIALLAVLKAGCTYVPLDPAYPTDRIITMLDDSAATVLISREKICARFRFGGSLIDLDQAASELEASPIDALPPDPDAGDLACIFYTSGSTGRPKGVMLRHTATAMIDWAAALFSDGALARVAATTSICFDPSMFEIFAPLSVGGTIVLKNDLLDPFSLEDRPSMLNGVPSAFAELARAGRIPDTVRVINVGGERLTAKLAREIYQCSNVAQVWNHYGPTEATICASVALVARDAVADPPIGKAMAGALLYVLDDAGNPVAPGETGELFIGGSSLAAGYLNLPELTAQQFLPDPFGADGNGSSERRMYRTGDLVRRAHDGDLFFIGRKGRQVKFRGYRIELEEIEAALRKLPAIENAAVTGTEREGVVHRLVAVVASSEALTLCAVRAALRGMLPVHMLPTKLVVMASLPLTQSGKIDRQAIDRMQTDECVAIPDRSGSATTVEAVIVNIYRSLLGEPSFDEQDDFFDHGGDSLLAVSAATQLEQLLGRPVPVSLLYDRRTPARLATALDDDKRPTPHLTMLQPTGAGEPLFFLPDMFGQQLSLLSLAQQFRGERPVYGLLPGTMQDGLTALTHAYIQEIDKIQRVSRYLLVGYSAGAIPAIDLACALEARGDRVVLALIDPVAQRISIGPRDSLGRRKRAIKALWMSGRQAAANAFSRRELPDWVPAAYQETTQALLNAEAGWSSRVFSGNVLFATCRYSDPLDRLLGAAWNGFSSSVPIRWRAHLSGKAQVKAFNVGHYDVVQEPFVSNAAQWLRQAFATAAEALPPRQPT